MPAKQAIQKNHEIPTETDETGVEGIALNAAELIALRRQGFISRETRGRSTIFKLRFRMNGQQRVRYLGTDERRIAAIQAALNKLQAGRALDRRLRDLEQQARERLKDSKQRLFPVMKAAGWRFHGRAIRRMRTKSRTMSDAVK